MFKVEFNQNHVQGPQDFQASKWSGHHLLPYGSVRSRKVFGGAKQSTHLTKNPDVGCLWYKRCILYSWNKTWKNQIWSQQWSQNMLASSNINWTLRANGLFRPQRGPQRQRDQIHGFPGKRPFFPRKSLLFSWAEVLKPFSLLRWNGFLGRKRSFLGFKQLIFWNITLLVQNANGIVNISPRSSWLQGLNDLYQRVQTCNRGLESKLAGLWIVDIHYHSFHCCNLEQHPWLKPKSSVFCSQLIRQTLEPPKNQFLEEAQDFPA